MKRMSSTGFFSKTMSLTRANQYPRCCIELCDRDLARTLSPGNCLPVGLSAMIFPRMIVFVMEVKPEARRFACPGDLERKFGAGAVLVKERIGRLQQNRLPA